MEPLAFFVKELDLEVLCKSQELGNTDFISLLLYKAKKKRKNKKVPNTGFIRYQAVWIFRI
jgi:hypothetical protein